MSRSPTLTPDDWHWVDTPECYGVNWPGRVLGYAGGPERVEVEVHGHRLTVPRGSVGRRLSTCPDCGRELHGAHECDGEEAS